MAGILRAYQKTLQNFPVLVQSIQVGALMGIGDVIAQKFFTKDKSCSFDYRRNASFILLGAIIVGPATSIWYRLLDNNISGSKAGITLKKVIWDQFIFSPFFLAIFLVMLQTIETRSLDEAKETVRDCYFDVLKANWSIWPLVQLGNFYKIRVNYQTLVVQTVNIGWHAYLSYKTHIK